MKTFKWNDEKNQKLLAERGLSFEMVINSIQAGNLLDDVIHPNQEKYEHQRILVVRVQQYVYLVPYVETEYDIFLKTIIPSRKATKMYLGESNE